MSLYLSAQIPNLSAVDLRYVRRKIRSLDDCILMRKWLMILNSLKEKLFFQKRKFTSPPYLKVVGHWRVNAIDRSADSPSFSSEPTSFMIIPSLGQFPGRLWQGGSEGPAGAGCSGWRHGKGVLTQSLWCSTTSHLDLCIALIGLFVSPSFFFFL